jgi:hypothetical protein
MRCSQALLIIYFFYHTRARTDSAVLCCVAAACCIPCLTVPYISIQFYTIHMRRVEAVDALPKMPENTIPVRGEKWVIYCTR